MSYVRCACGAVYNTVGTTTGMNGCCPKCGLHHSGQYRVAKPILKPSPLAAKPIDPAENIIEHTPIEYYVNHVMDEITKHDIERVSEKLRALGWEEVVRCRDCQYYYDVDELDDAQCHWFTDYYDQPVYWAEPDGFCKWGKRKENSNEKGNQR